MDVCTAPPVARVIEPEAELVAQLAEKKQAFREAYPRITPKKG